jgi:hypothetical protein
MYNMPPREERDNMDPETQAAMDRYYAAVDAYLNEMDAWEASAQGFLNNFDGDEAELVNQLTYLTYDGNG